MLRAQGFCRKVVVVLKSGLEFYINAKKLNVIHRNGKLDFFFLFFSYGMNLEDKHFSWVIKVILLNYDV